MKNLKKVLALVLAFACAFTMFAGAAFTDQADISQTEAVDMLSALGVINGYTDGSFKPDATITRAEAAKMIYTIWNGGNDDASAFEWKSVFNDVYSGHWAEGYINFCYTNGIINGTSATTFAPEESVTGTQLAKMLLICMGYQADKSGLEGTGYSQRTNALATQNGLYVDVASSVSNAMPRQYAAQIMYNALKADTVKWSTDSNAYEKVTTTSMSMEQDKDGKWQLVQTTTNETMGKKCMGLDTIENVQVREIDKENGRDTFTVKTSLSNDFTRVTTDYSDLLGMTVNVMVKDDDFSKVYGMYVDEDCSVVATGVVGQLEKDDADTFKLDGTSYDTDNDVDETWVYTLNSDSSYKKAVTLASIIGDAADKHNDAYSIKLIDTDNDGDVNHAVITPVYVTQVDYTNDKTMRVDGANLISGVDTSYDYADHTIAEDLETDDWVVVTDANYTVDDKAVIAKADVLTGTVQSTREKSQEIRIDGTWYKAADVCDDNLPSIGDDVDLVVLGGMYFDVSGASASLDVAVVTGVGNYNRMDKALEVRLMFKDGTEEVVNVEKWGDVEGAGLDDDTNTVKEDVLVSFDIDDDKYTLETISNSWKQGDDEYTGVTGTGMYDESRESITIGKEYDIDESATIFFNVDPDDDDDYMTVSGADLMNLDDIDFAGTAYGIVKDGAIVAMFAQTNDNVVSSDKSYGYIISAWKQQSSDGDDDNAMWVDIMTEDGLQEEVETSETFNSSWEGKVVTYTMNGDIMALDTENAVIGSVVNKSNRSVEIKTADGVNRYRITDDTIIIGIDGVGDDAEFAGNGASLIKEPYNNGYKNIFFKANNDDEIEIAIVQVDPDEQF